MVVFSFASFFTKDIASVNPLKGLSYEIDFENVDEN
jgi:hypothetical protein